MRTLFNRDMYVEKIMKEAYEDVKENQKRAKKCGNLYDVAKMDNILLEIRIMQLVVNAFKEGRTSLLQRLLIKYERDE